MLKLPKDRKIVETYHFDPYGDDSGNCTVLDMIEYEPGKTALYERLPFRNSEEHPYFANSWLKVPSTAHNYTTPVRLDNKERTLEAIKNITDGTPYTIDFTLSAAPSYAIFGVVDEMKIVGVKDSLVIVNILVTDAENNPWTILRNMDIYNLIFLRLSKGAEQRYFEDIFEAEEWVLKNVSSSD
jgi:hypothetical protein